MVSVLKGKLTKTVTIINIIHVTNLKIVNWTTHTERDACILEDKAVLN